MLRSLIRILCASLVQTHTEMAEYTPNYNNQRYAVTSHSEDMPQDVSALMGLATLTFEVGNLHSEFGHARPLNSQIICARRMDKRMDKSNAYCPFPYRWGIIIMMPLMQILPLNESTFNSAYIFHFLTEAGSFAVVIESKQMTASKSDYCTCNKIFNSIINTK